MATKRLTSGIFITLEGPEGCGKSTQAKLLCEYLSKRSYAYLHTREPGGTKAGERIRSVLLKSNGVAISDLAELFLFEAARAQIVTEVIRPAIEDGVIVVCDRFSDATVCYQGYAGGVPLKVIDSLNRIATGGLKPDITILLDIDTRTGLQRAKKKGIDRMEKKDITYHERVRSGYLKLAKKEPGRIKVIKVNKGISEIQNMIRDEVEVVIQRHKRTR